MGTGACRCRCARWDDAALRIFTAAIDTTTPDWTQPKTLAQSLDTLVNVGAQTLQPQRYVWVRVELNSDARRRVSPVLQQISNT